MTALGTSWSAGQPRTRFAGCINQCGVHDLHELRVFRRQAHAASIRQCRPGSVFPSEGSCYNTFEVTLLYLERTPAAPLERCIRALWYAQTADVPCHRERVLPSGCMQVILNLARDYLLDCPEGASELRRPPALVLGARTVYEFIDSSDIADLIGIVFAPGGFSAFASDAADLFSNRSIPLEDVWGPAVTGLRDRLREMNGPINRLRYFEQFLFDYQAAHVTRHGPWRHREIDFAVRQFDAAPHIATVREVARQTGWSERRFSTIFREHVGLSPKAWCRVRRFQSAVRQLHAGGDVPWAQVALDCGFYDQSHFANEFRAFSGIDATTYSARRTVWANHVPVE